LNLLVLRQIYALICEIINNDKFLAAYLNHVLFCWQVGIYYNEKKRIPYQYSY
jgi:hypothetical protein